MEAGRAGLFGREAVLGRVSDAIRGDASVAVVGEAGIGKTALIRAAAAAAGRELREGGGFATLGGLPYFALERALGVALAGDPTIVADRVELGVGPDTLFIDDLQWVDGATLEVLDQLAGRVPLVVASRDDGGPAHDLIGRLAGAGAIVIPLTGLEPDAAAGVIGATRAGLAPQLVAAIIRRAAGNPLLLEALAAHGEVPPAVERALLGQLATLEPAARLVIELLAVADHPLPRAALGDGAEAAIRAGLVAQLDPDAGLAIRHELVAAAVRDGLDAPTRRRLHGLVADIVTNRAETARHLAAAGRESEAVAVALEALEGEPDPRERSALLVVAAEATPGAAGASLRLEAARALDEVAEWAAVRAVLEPELPAADQDGPAFRPAEGFEGAPGPENELAEPAVERDAILAHAAFALGDFDAARAHLAAAAGRTIRAGSPADARRAVEQATFLVNVEGAVGEALAIIDAAVVVAGPGDAADLAVLKASILLLAVGAGDPSTVAAAADSAFAAGRFRTATDRHRVLQYLLLLGASSEAALQFLLGCRDRYAAAGLASVARAFLADAVVAAHLGSRPSDAVGLADELLEQASPPRARQTAEIFRARSLAILGRLDEADAALVAIADRVSPDFLGRGELFSGRAEIAWWGGRPRAALDFARAALAIPPPIPASHVRPTLTAAWASRDLGLEPPSLPRAVLPPSLAAATPELRGIECLGREDLPAAEGAFAEAAAAWAGFDQPRALVCRWAAADAARRGDDPAAAVADLREVLRDATAMGFEPLAARARRSLRQAGARVAQAPRGRTGDRPGLTIRERELVALVERGMTNIEIARRLGLGRPTVARILASAMAKVGVEHRTQLASARGAEELV